MITNKKNHEASMSKFYNITQSEIENFLFPQGFEKMNIAGTVELVYGKIYRKSDKQISMRIYTAINPNGQSRDCGSDAIRIAFFVKINNKVINYKEGSKVLRINTWQKNLQKAIDNWDSDYKSCPACGNPMILRNGKNGEFWACSAWPITKCNGRSIKPQVEELPKPVVAQKVISLPQNSFKIPENQISQYQKSAEEIFRNTDCHLILPSRAGGGKTTMLKHLASFRQDRESMAYLAFNRKNANEGKKKLPREVNSTTTHSFCGRMLRENNIAMPEKVDTKKNLAIMNHLYPAMKSPERKIIRKACFKLINLSKNFGIYPGELEKIESLIENYGIEITKKEEIKIVVEIVNEALTLSMPNEMFGSIYDYDDMIWWPIVLDLKPTFYDVVLLDEVQDFNACQLELVKRMIENGTRVVAVGDPYQAVYRFRGADSDAFDKLSQLLNAADRDCKTVLLPTNYRCSKAVIDWTKQNTVVKDIEVSPNAVQGSVQNFHSYIDIVDRLVDDFKKGELPKSAILCRTNSPLVSCAFDLIRRNMKVKIVGRDIATQLKEIVGDVLEYRRNCDIIEFGILLNGWINQKRERFHDDENSAILAEFEDQYSALETMTLNCKDAQDIYVTIDSYFVDGESIEEDDSTIILASGHRSKGLEWQRVVWIRFDLCPHKGAKKEADKKQEDHLMYILATRSQVDLWICSDSKPE